MDDNNDNNNNTQPNQPAPDQTEGNAQRAPHKRATPQQVPPLPRSRFTRFLVDYVGAGQYQLSAQGRREVPLPLAKGGDPSALVTLAMRTADAGDEIVVAPLVALVHVVTQISTEQFAGMHALGEDPFDVIGVVFTMDGKGESDLPADAPIPRGPSSPARRISGMHESKLPPEVRDLLDRDSNSGGRIGWVLGDQTGNDASDDGGTPPAELN